jgi:hypothetical protein
MAVQLGDQPLLVPDAVGLEPSCGEVEVDVLLGPGQAGPVEEVEEAALQLAARDPCAGRRQNRPDCRGAGATWMSGEEVIKRKQIP